MTIGAPVDPAKLSAGVARFMATHPDFQADLEAGGSGDAPPAPAPTAKGKGRGKRARPTE
jgi:hypothetical protein